MPYDDHVSANSRHSIYGRKLAIDFNGFIIGPPSDRNATETITTTAPSTLAVGGTSVLLATAAAAYELPTPRAEYVGIQKRIINASTGATVQNVKLPSGNFLVGGSGSVGSTFTTIVLSTRGGMVDLEYLTTALVAVITQTSSLSSGFTAFTTTT